MKVLDTIRRADLVIFNCLFNANLKLNLTFLAKLISRSADGPLYFGIGLLFIYFENWPWLQVIIIAFTAERILYFMLKKACKRNRPAQAIARFNSIITPSDQFSFPSGHTSAAFLMVTILFSSSTLTLAPLFLWAVSVGFSRVFLGVHFITDTMAGALLGSSVALLTIGVVI